MSGRATTSTFAMLIAIFVLVFAAPAFAQTSPTTDAYGGVKGGEVTGGPEDIVPPPAAGPADDEDEDAVPAVRREQGGPPATTPTADSLPFTGFEAGLVALLGLGLLGAGVVARRTSRPRPTA